MSQLDDALAFAITTDGHAKVTQQKLCFFFCLKNKQSIEEVANYDEVRGKIFSMLTALRDDPQRKDTPRIYHLDVGAMLVVLFWF
jgi:hypothetical protein